MDKGKELLKSIHSVRKYGLLRLKPVKEHTYFECLKDKCDVNCCWVFDKVQVENREIENTTFQVNEIDGIKYLKRKNYNCRAGNACIEFFNGKCNIYENRPKSCREYPWYKFNNKIYYDSRCPGIIHKMPSNCPSSNSLLNSDRYFNVLPKTISKIVIWYLMNIKF
jgi:Fe-S-cluster containining protein